MKKVKARIDCVGLGYELKVDETAEMDKKLADKLIGFGYVEEIETRKPKETKVKE
jgi:hypothetical protein